MIGTVSIHGRRKKVKKNTWPHRPNIIMSGLIMSSMTGYAIIKKGYVSTYTAASKRTIQHRLPSPKHIPMFLFTGLSKKS